MAVVVLIMPFTGLLVLTVSHKIRSGEYADELEYLGNATIIVSHRPEYCANTSRDGIASLLASIIFLTTYITGYQLTQD